MQTLPNLIFYILSFVLLWAASKVYIFLARRFTILDIPNERSSHVRPIIRGGGILFYVAFFIFSARTGFENLQLFFAVTILAIISFLDDIKGLSVRQRIPIQAIAIILVLLGLNEEIHWLLIIPLTVFGILIINCYNFIDGINGMLGLYSTTVFLFVGYVFYKEQIFNQDFAPILLLSTIVFGFYNYRKRARFFSGDVGSMTLGILIFFSVCWLIWSLKAPVFLLFIGVALTDTIGTIVKRFLSGKNIFEAHREHIYERLSDFTNLSHIQISGIYAGLQLLANILVIFVCKLSIALQISILGGVIIFSALMYYTISKQISA